MAKRSRPLEIGDDHWLGLRNLKKRYNRPMKEIAKTIFDNTDLRVLDRIYGYRRNRKL